MGIKLSQLHHNLTQADANIQISTTSADNESVYQVFFHHQFVTIVAEGSDLPFVVGNGLRWCGTYGRRIVPAKAYVQYVS